MVKAMMRMFCKRNAPEIILAILVCLPAAVGAIYKLLF